MTAPLLRMREIVKRYGEVLAVDRVDFELSAGEVHGLVGENGAGKSTLMKILAGALRADSGTVEVEGIPVQTPSPQAALHLGIGMIYQDLRLVPELTVAENIVLGDEPRRGARFLIDRDAMATRAAAVLDQLGERLPLNAKVGTLSAARCQVVEIARALARRVRILILDEPTAPLTEHETAGLFRVVRRLREEGVGIIYITHRLDEIAAITDRVTVLRDGISVATAPTQGLGREDLIRLMVGRELGDEYPKSRLERREPVLQVKGLVAPGVRDVSFTLYRGEVLGLAGLVGAGRSDLALALFGASHKTAGSVSLDGTEVAPRSPGEAISLGIGLLTEDRNRLGLVAPMNVRENVTLASLDELKRGPLVDRRRERARVRDLVERLRIRTPSTETPVDHLSGGNRQKVVLARWLASRSRVLIFDEPTAGVDVGARYEIYSLIDALAREGTAVLVISSDLPELLGICDRILVMSEGQIVGDLSGSHVTQEAIMSLAAGGAA